MMDMAAKFGNRKKHLPKKKKINKADENYDRSNKARQEKKRRNRQSVQ